MLSSFVGFMHVCCVVKVGRVMRRWWALIPIIPLLVVDYLEGEQLYIFSRKRWANYAYSYFILSLLCFWLKEAYLGSIVCDWELKISILWRAPGSFCSGQFLKGMSLVHTLFPFVYMGAVPYLARFFNKILLTKCKIVRITILKEDIN